MVRVRAPDLPQTGSWLNCDQSVSLKDLRGYVVILDFWTYSCINCLHVIPDVRYLEQKYGDRLVVIGIHTAKFDHEHDLESVRQAIARYGIMHPVVVDSDRHVWEQYAVRAWPTFVVIDPMGYVVATISGEGQRENLDRLIQQLIADLAKNGAKNGAENRTLDTSSVSLSPQSPALHTSPLAFPGNVVADAELDTLFIADTQHHRIVITTLNGTLKSVIGTGIAGWRDGDYETAQFSSPQGLAIDRQTLYVADTGNHLIRHIDRSQQHVSTIAGTGVQSRWLFPHGGKALDVDLNSPWDLVIVDVVMYVAMAGAHQIWAIDRDGTSQTFIGTGAEFCVDGTRDTAAFAQPSGTTTDGNDLFVVDSETSSVRRIRRGESPTADTVCGSGQLFEFGDRDGIGSNVRLQHCLGLTYG
ncbi:MAG TPA: thioredoxin-like domain-containing protein, partial [Elainellaceae cyanobacterium]